MPYEQLVEKHRNVEFSPCPGRPQIPDLYQFPRTRFIRNSLWRQWWHLLSEVLEIGLALLKGDVQHASVETWDVKQCAETLHHILAGRGADVEAAREAMETKNDVRGYYLISLPEVE